MPATICRAKPTWAISVVAAPIITFVLFCHVLIYPLAQRSLIAGSPFHRFWCLRALYQRHSPSDIAAVYTAIQNANWTTELPWDGMGDYRAQCVEFLQAHDPRHAAEFLSQQLRAHPSYLLAEAAAPLLVEQKRYETAPLLMRYSWTWLSAGQSNDPPLCAGALADMGVPAAALPILVQCDPTVDPTTRSRLTQLLGTDAGPELDAWNKLYGAVIKHRPTPLTPQLTAEINRTIHMALAYADALRSRAWGAQRLAARRMVRIGETEATDTQLANDPDLNYRLHLYLPDALADFTVPSPDQDVPTVDEFQREIERYKSRVEALLTQYHIIQPATTPATVPAR